jgi:ketosteroid isomerase-like protein
MSVAMELVKIALRAYGTGDVEITLQLSDPLIRWDERASRADGELVWGHDDVLRALHSYLDGYEEYRFEVEKIAEVGDGKIVGQCRERGRDASGIRVDRRYGGLWIVENGKIISWATYLTPREAVHAAREVGSGRFAHERADQAAQAQAAQDAPKKRRPQPKPGDPDSFSEEQRRAAKRRAQLARAAREAGHRAATG